MSIVKFSESEMKRIGSYKIPGSYGSASVEQPRLSTPITPRENALRVFRGEKPLWLPNMNRDMNLICPDMMPDAPQGPLEGLTGLG